MRPLGQYSWFTDIATSGVWGNYRSHYARLVDTPLAGIQCSSGIQAFARSRSGSRRAAHSQRATPSLVASGISPMFLRAMRAVCVSECNALALVSSGIHAGRRADKRPCRTCALLLDIRSVCVPLCCCCPTTFHQSARIHGSQLTPPPKPARSYSSPIIYLFFAPHRHLPGLPLLQNQLVDHERKEYIPTLEHRRLSSTAILLSVRCPSFLSGLDSLLPPPPPKPTPSQPHPNPK